MQAARKRRVFDHEKARSMTAAKMEQRRRQAERFRRAEAVALAQVGRLLGEREAWRRWEDSDALAQPLVER